MTEQQFISRKWKSFQEVIYANKRMRNIDEGSGVEIPCLIVAIDFDDQLIKILPAKNDYYNDVDPFWVRYEDIEIPKPKLKIAL